MFKNYIKIAWRNLTKQKSFTSITVVGLSIGFASALLLFSVIKYELSFDTFQPHYDRIYQVVTKDDFGNTTTFNSGIPAPALEALKIEFPQVLIGSMLINYGSQVTVVNDNTETHKEDKKFIEQSGFFFCDPEIFRVFHYDWLIGSPEVLAEPNVTVLTQKMGDKYFGDWKNSYGKYLKLDNKILVKVAGIIKDPPANSDFPLGVITSHKTLKTYGDDYSLTYNWNTTSSNFAAFMLLPKNVTVQSVNEQLKGFNEKYNPNTRKNSYSRSNFLLPLSEIHFDKRFPNFGDHTTSKATLWTLSLIGIFILLMACINYINLSTARGVGRSKEIGIRKVLGGFRYQLFIQIIGETALIVFISVLLAIGISLICLPFIKHVALIQEPLHILNIQTVSFLILLSVFVIFIAGSYPAMVLSGFKPALALKNKMTTAKVGGMSIRRALVIIQFAISQILIIGTIVAITQMNFVKNADLGFRQETVLLFNANADSAFHTMEESFKQKVLQLPGVESLSFSSDAPSTNNMWATNFAFDNRPDEKTHVSLKFTDEDYFKTFGLQFLAGGPFQKSDTIRELVINETLSSLLGITPEKAIGKEIKLGRGGWKKIAGVVKDFKTSSLKDPIKPTAITSLRNNYSVTAIKLNTASIAKTKASIEKVWNDYFPQYAYTTSFMDENIAEFYKQENQLELLYKIFAGIAILISCLGLYGLVSFMAVQKTKEIGVRKVLGASVKSILFIFSREFSFLIIIGSLISIPLSWYFMNNWLQNFAFRIEISPFVFVITILISVFVASLAVGYKSIKAALANPVKSLRTE